MIFINKVTKVGEKRIINIPNMYQIADGIINEIDCGGAGEEEYVEVINGGFADTINYDFELNGGFALFSEDVVTDVQLVHTISKKKFASILRPTQIDDNYFTIEIIFDEIPPQGQYQITIYNSNNLKIYSDLLQIGDFENNNITYNREIKIKIYEK